MTPDQLANLRAVCEAARHRDGDIRGWGYLITGDAAATNGWPRVGVCLECRAEVTTCDEDGAHSCGGYVVVCAGKDSAEQAIEFADVAEQNRIAVQEFTRWQRTGPRGCPPYESAIAGMLMRLDKAFAALRAVEDTLRAERDELAAEVAALTAEAACVRRANDRGVL